jgi:hypothetical protein
MQREQWKRGSNLKVKEKEKDIVFNCVPHTRERSRGGENPVSTKNREEEATLVNQTIPHHHLSSSSLKVLFATMWLKCKIVMGPTNSNSCFTVTKQFIFVVFSKHSRCRVDKQPRNVDAAATQVCFSKRDLGMYKD